MYKLQHWLDGISENDMDIHENSDVAELYQLFTEEDFIAVLLVSISFIFHFYGQVITD